MAFEQPRREALRILEGIEDGTMSASDSAELVARADPALIYLIFTWLRRRYAGHANADSVLSRLAAVSERPAIAARVKEGQDDPIVEWFQDSYSYRELEKDKFIELVIEKIEG